MDNLEKYFRENRTLFDDAEPDPGHFDRFRERLEKEETASVRKFNLNRWIRVAAAAVILVTAGLITREFVTGRANASGLTDVATLNIPQDVKDAYQYYDQASDRTLNEISRLTQSCPQANRLVSQARKEISSFDANSRELAKALSQNPGNERIQAAFIQNQKMKEETLSNILLEGTLNNCNKRNQ